MASRILSQIRSAKFDLIIIGAGINGAGIARDAALRGLKVLLLDKGDIGGGTTSWSTRLIHGGLRYLEHGEFGLVRESLREREILFAIAPHLVKPLQFLIPCYKEGRRGRWTIRAGMIAYDLLSYDKSLPRHQMLSPAKALAQAPGLNANGLLGAALYYDAQVEFAERLVLENALAAREHGATIITYARVRRIVFENGLVTGVEFRDEFEGGTYEAASDIVINASGPWVDHLLANLPQPSEKLIGGTKGSHIVVAPFTGAPTIALYVESESNRRPFFIIPWNNNYLIGTTDIHYEEDLDRVEIDEDETRLLLAETNRVIPSAKLTRDDILYTYSGVRPLAYTDIKDEQRITRKHFIRTHPRLQGLISIVGGKLTTYRHLSQQTVDLVLQMQKRAVTKCLTAEIPLPGATPEFSTFAAEFIAEGALLQKSLERLLRIYGTRAAEVVSLVRKDSSLADIFSNETDAMAAEIIFAFEEELAQTLADCLLRRTMVGLSATVGIADDEAVARICKRYLGWSETRAKKEVVQYRRVVGQLLPA